MTATMDGSTIFIAVQKVYYPLLCIVGIPAVIYLSCLAIMDTFYLVWVILLDLCLTFLQLQPFWHSHPWCGLLGILQYGALYSSSWVVVVFTIERYLVLSVTAAKQRFTRPRTTVLTCVSIVLASHLVSVPMGWINEVTPVNHTLASGNATLLPRCRYREAVYSTVIVWVTSFLSAGVPIVLVIIYNALIAYHLCRSSRLFTKEERRTIRGANTQGMVRRTIALLGTVSAAFVVLSLPRFVTYCILRTRYNHRDFDRNDYALAINVASDAANMLQNLNSTTNFLLYCVVSRRFRRELLATLTCRGKKARELSSFITQNTMKVFAVAQHASRSPAREPIHVVLTEHKPIESFSCSQRH
ncbi:probable G-protein coupled receptor 139 [Sardina pilchardus]|uniref:probable G-protein coupled receptor 139 n=1 Tax=Sardina pilchardus TaxID=27697 RepID=UPI002E103399